MNFARIVTRLNIHAGALSFVRWFRDTVGRLAKENGFVNIELAT